MKEIVKEDHLAPCFGTLYIIRDALRISKVVHRCIIGRIMQHEPLKQFHCVNWPSAHLVGNRALADQKEGVPSAHRRRKGYWEDRGRHGCSRQKREPVKALILNTWVTSQYLDALTRAIDISPSGLCLRAWRVLSTGWRRYSGISLAIFTDWDTWALK